LAVGSKYFSDWIGFGTVLCKNLPAAKYEIFIQYAWPNSSSTSTQVNNIAKDFTLRVYAAEKVEIYDESGMTKEPYSHDYNFWPAQLKAAAELKIQNELTAIVTGLMTQTDTSLFKLYKNRTASWFKEFSGPQVVSVSSKGVATYSATR
jgi:hypothetical protein